MIKSSEVIAKLAPLKTDGTLRFVGGSADFNASVDQLKVSPSAFVMPSGKRPGPDEMITGVTHQRVSQQFTVMLGFNRAGATGADKLDEIEDVEAAVIDELLGWQPEGVVHPVIYAGGRLVGINIQKGIIFWGSDFTAGYYLRK